jgi:hypothetical protein
MANLMISVDKKFGAGKAVSQEGLYDQIYGVKCPLAFAYVNGGCDVLPCGRIFGGDGPPGHYKSAFTLEEARWVLIAGGVVFLVDTEHKQSSTMTVSMLMDLPLEIRRRFRHIKADSLDEAQKIIRHLLDKSQEIHATLPKDQQVPLMVIHDSLTGKDTEGDMDKLKKEGSAQARSFSTQAMSISKFYKGVTFEGSMFMLAHVQHAKKNQDQYALKVDRMKAAGGDAPRFYATIHYRMEKAKEIEAANLLGKDVTMWMAKSGLGPDARTLDLRVRWEYVWVDTPQFDDDDKLQFDGEALIPKTQAKEIFDASQGIMDPKFCDIYLATLDLLPKPVEVPKKGAKKAEDGPAEPVVEMCRKPLLKLLRYQHTWFDWNHILGGLMHDLLFGGALPALEAKEFSKFMPLSKSGCNNDFMKSKDLFGDSEPRSYADIGARIVGDPELTETVKVFLCITSYRTYQEYARDIMADYVKKVKKGKKGKKGDEPEDGEGGPDDDSQEG